LERVSSNVNCPQIIVSPPHVGNKKISSSISSKRMEKVVKIATIAVAVLAASSIPTVEAGERRDGFTEWMDPQADGPLVFWIGGIFCAFA